jgi:hypothetical protein
VVADSTIILACDISWDYLIRITAAGETELLDNNGDAIKGRPLFIVYDYEQDIMIIDLLHSEFPLISPRTKIQVIITPPGIDEIADKSEPFSTETPSPARVKVLFAFWNTFSSDTPAQTLRAWAGAHAGPMSSPHGLKYLIAAAEHTNSTVFLLDLLTPQNISALDYIDTLPWIQILSARGVLALPALSNEDKKINGYLATADNNLG